MVHNKIIVYLTILHYQLLSIQGPILHNYDMSILLQWFNSMLYEVNTVLYYHVTVLHNSLIIQVILILILQQQQYSSYSVSI